MTTASLISPFGHHNNHLLDEIISWEINNNNRQFVNVKFILLQSCKKNVK